MAVLSALPVTIRVPSGLNATLIPRPVALEFEKWRSRPRVHTFAVWSSLPVTIRVPSGLNATLFTCPVAFQVEQRRPGPRSHTFASVLTSGDDPRAVRAERHAVTLGRVTL